MVVTVWIAHPYLQRPTFVRRWGKAVVVALHGFTISISPGPWKFDWQGPDKMAVKDKRRQEQERIATPFWADKTKMAVFYKLAKALSDADVRYHVDRIVPLKSEFVCGLHVEYNLEVVSAEYNSAKGNSYWPHGYGEHDIENLQHKRMS